MAKGRCGTPVALASVLALAGIAAPPVVMADGELHEAAIEVLAEHFYEDGPGAAVAIVDGDEVTIACYGLADVEAGKAITPNTLFDLASVSKQFTAAAVLRLEVDGAIDLGQPVQALIDDFRMPVKGRAITVRDLLHHLSGLPDYSSDDWDGSDRAFAELSTETHLDWLNRQRAQSSPGRSYRYNNSGYALLGLLIERISGQSQEAFMREQLFAPAGMRDVQVLDQIGERFRLAATGYAADDDVFTPSFSPTRITGDGNVYAHIVDMARWAQALEGDRIFSATQRDRLWRNGRFDSGQPLDDGEGYGYGLGWVLDEEADRQSHSGSWDGTATYLLRDGEYERWVIVLSNDENAEVETIAEALIEL